MNVNPKMIEIARESRGLNQGELAKKIGMSVSSVSRMEDGYTIDVPVQLLSKELNYPESFFYQSFSVQPPNIHYRKKLTLPAKTIRKADALMNIYKGNIEKMLKTLDLDAANLPLYNQEKYASPNKIAEYIRSYWSVEKGAIKDLITLVEKHGIMVIMFDFETDKIDGRSMMTEDGHPIIFLNKFFPGERQRMTLAHEIGHIVMHLRTIPTFGRDEEAEAFAFASELLMPEREIKSDLSGKLTFEKLADLKRIWKVSMAALIYWAEKLSAITPNQSRYLWSQYSTNGFKKGEPLPVNVEPPTLINRMLKAYIECMEFEEDKTAKDEVAKIFCLDSKEFEDRYLIHQKKLRVV